MADRRVTMLDVAREADLSVASVSRALSGTRQVGDDIRERVQRAAYKLGYRPDPIARALRSGHFATAGFVVPDITSPFFPALAAGLEAALRESGWSMLLLSAGNDPEQERECIEELLAQRVKNIIVSPVHRLRSRAAIEYASRFAAIVQIDRYASLRSHRVLADPAQTICLALDHMAAQGCRSFAFIGAADAASVSTCRLAAFRKIVSTFDADGCERTLTGDYSLTWGRRAAAKLLERWPSVDAVVCANDLIALGAVQELLAQGRRVPDDIAVTGCDDTFFGVTSRPSITSIEQPVVIMAAHAVRLLTVPSAGGAVTLVAPPRLRVRESTRRRAAG